MKPPDKFDLFSALFSRRTNKEWLRHFKGSAREAMFMSFGDNVERIVVAIAIVVALCLVAR